MLNLTTVAFAFILYGVLYAAIKRKNAKDKTQLMYAAKIKKKPLSGNTAAICKN